MLHSTEEILARIARLLERSPAARTSVLWREELAGTAGHGGRARPPGQTLSRTVVVGVEEGGRSGSCAVSSDDPDLLAMAVREATAAARLHPGPPWPDRPEPGPEPGPPEARLPLHDPELAGLDPEQASRHLAGLLERRASGQLSWWDARLVVADSRGLRRSAALTAASLELRWGRRAGAGHAGHAARSLAALEPEGVAARARRRHAAAGLEEEELRPGEAPPAVLAGEAAARLLAVFAAAAFDGRGHAEGSSWLARADRPAALSPLLSVVDDPLASDGLPLPFDLEGAPKRRHPLLDRGRPGAPVAGGALAAESGGVPSGHALGAGEALPLHPRLVPGSASEAELLAEAAGGIWIGEIGPVELFDPPRLGARFAARGVRRIDAGGELGAPLADLGWEGPLAELLGAVAGVGRETVCRPVGIGWLGGAVAPCLRLGRLPGRCYPLPATL